MSRLRTGERVMCRRSAGAAAFPFFWVASSTAWAQPGPRYTPPSARPAVSPYLNLTRTGTDPAINYYGIVRPQLEFNNSIQNLNRQVGALEAGAGLSPGLASELPAT